MKRFTARAASIAFSASLLLSIPVPSLAGDCGVDPVYDRDFGATVTTGARVRDIACMDGSYVLTTLAVGTRVTIIAETDGWYKVRTSSGTTGWVGQWLLSVGGEPPAAPTPAPVPSPSVTVQPLPAAGLIKGASGAAVYHVANGKRYAFPNDRIYKSWYANFSGVVTVADKDLSTLPLAANVTYRPGVRLVKIATDPRVYAVSRYGVLRWITSEDAARTLYGDAWNTTIDDIPDAFFANYLVGDPIATAADFDRAAEEGVADLSANVRPAGFSI